VFSARSGIERFRPERDFRRASAISVERERFRQVPAERFRPKRFFGERWILEREREIFRQNPAEIPSREGRPDGRRRERERERVRFAGEIRRRFRREIIGRAKQRERERTEKREKKERGGRGRGTFVLLNTFGILKNETKN
jgi:hypothetical protein